MNLFIPFTIHAVYRCNAGSSPCFAQLMTVCLIVIFAGDFSSLVLAQSPPDKPPADTIVAAEPIKELSVPALADSIKKSLVVVRTAGRDGSDLGLGTGFVISEDGLIATARHTIEEGHGIRVETADGTILPVTHIHARLEAMDLVVLRVSAKELQPLPLGDSDKVVDGQSVVAVGHPKGLRDSVVSGVVSGREDINDISMLRLAMIIEPGSSGEPVVDRRGNVIGLVTLKSSQKQSVGFAVPIVHLKRMLEDPAPIPISRWMKIGALDPQRWTTLWGANWHQRAGRVVVDGYGTSFGGRSLCLRSTDPPDIPFEVQVEVKMDDESGAAGLAFHADGGDLHYGFYPSNGNIRLTRFNGPELGSWTILHNEPHAAYRANDWNTFKVRIEEDHFACYLNEELILKSVDDVIPPGRIGLATFRGTSAAFRKYQFARSLPSQRPTSAAAAAIAAIIADVKATRPAPQQVIQRMRPYAGYSSRILEDQALQLELRAKRMRQLAADVHGAGIREQILQTLGLSKSSAAAGQATATSADTDKAEADAPTKEDVDLLKAALLIAVLDNDEVEPNAYLERVDKLAREIRESLPDDASESDRLQALDHMMFEEFGYRGSRFEYYTSSNSYLNEVIDDREGLPITLSVLYMEVARRVGLKMVGLGLPGHYMVRFEPTAAAATPQIIDVFNKGKRVSQQEAEQLVKSRGFPLLPKFFEAQQPRQIVQRMITNLLGLAEQGRDDDRVLRYLELLVALDDSDIQFRAKRLEIRARTGRIAEALDDVDWFIRHPIENANNDWLHELRADLEMRLERQTKEAP